MMENDIFNIQMDMTGQNPIVEDGISSLATSNSLGQSRTCYLNNQNQTMSGYSLLSPLEADTLASRSMPIGRNALRDASLVSSNSNFNTEFQEHFSGGTPISATALATLLSTRSGLHEDLNDIAVSPSSVFPTKVLGTYVPNSTTHIPNSSLAATANCGYDGVNCDTNNKWDFDKFFVPPELGGKHSERAKFQPIQFMGNMDQNGWISSTNANATTNNSHTCSTFSNELSLSLGTPQPSIFYETSIPVGCSEISCSGLTRCCLNETVLPSDQTSCNSKDLSLAPFRPDQFSQVISGSKYNPVIQDILTDIASYSLENIDKRSHSTGGVNIPFSSSFPAERGDSVMSFDESTNEDRRVVQMESALQREAKKTQLLALLQVVDDRYNQCSNEIHTVISAFHAATELDPQIHARFALQTISFFYKNLRDRISNQLIAMGGNFESGCTTRKDEVFETSFAPKQWAIQQLRGKDHAVWRPQRGLPERSVSVLRAWMFQNFLHPYPKDAEKHLLAVRSGLTRSQVSNWFINARVRLWKPMIDEMYSEMNSRKALEGVDSSCKTHISIQGQRYRMS